MNERDLNRTYPGGLPGYSGGPYHRYSELFYRLPTWQEVEDILRADAKITSQIWGERVVPVG
jgi:hypothetical protein